jgi:hypothetical protein
VVVQRSRGLAGAGGPGARSGMTRPDAVLFPVVVSAGADRLHMSTAAYLSRYKG